MTSRKILFMSSFCFIFLFLLTPNLSAEEKKAGWWNYAQNKAQRDDYEIITTEELVEFYSRDADFIIIDSRYGYEYQESHLPGAKNISFDVSHTSNLPEDKKSELLKILGSDPHKIIITYCRDFR